MTSHSQSASREEALLSISGIRCRQPNAWQEYLLAIYLALSGLSALGLFASILMLFIASHGAWLGIFLGLIPAVVLACLMLV